MDSKRFTWEYFTDEFSRFWDLLGLKTTTSTVAIRAWYGLAYVAVNTDGDDEKISNALRAAQENLVRRLPYFDVLESRSLCTEGME